MICLESQSPNNQDWKWWEGNTKEVREEHFLKLKEVRFQSEGTFEEPSVMEEFSHLKPVIPKFQITRNTVKPVKE